MTAITDDYMQAMLKTTKLYTLIILRRASGRSDPGADRIVWEHGRRLLALRRDGLLSIVCPLVKDESDVAGICIFNTDLGETRRVMDDDPTVKAGIFSYEAHVLSGFPGDSLAK